MSNFIELAGGAGFLYNWYGKYRPNLTLLFRELPADDSGEASIYAAGWQELRPEELNLEERGGSIRALRGEYFKSRKGTDCFRVRQDGPHMLLQHDWHRRQNITLLPDEDFAYYRHASSNGGGTGYTYAVAPVGWRRRVSIDDI